MTERLEQEIPLNWTRRRGRATKARTATVVARRIPRITRLLALAIRFQDMVDRGEVRDLADLARLGMVTRARLTQIMNLLLLAPDIQEEILAMDADPDREALTERSLRSVVSSVLWEHQRALLDW